MSLWTTLICVPQLIVLNKAGERGCGGLRCSCSTGTPLLWIHNLLMGIMGFISR